MIKYEDQVKIMEKLRHDFDPKSETERGLKAQSEEFLYFLEKLEVFNLKDLKKFMEVNNFTERDTTKGKFLVSIRMHP